MNPNNPILEFTDVTVAPKPLEHAGLSHLNARFEAGTLAMIQVEPGNEQLPIADLATGLIDPAEGHVLFEGKAWNAMPPEDALRQRARVGRVFEGRGWVSNLNVKENVTLAQRHHTARAHADILAEAITLAHAFGLPDLFDMRPAVVKRQDLRRSEWIRAFLGHPQLILLERPMQGVPMEHLPRLVGMVKKACQWKAAVLWLTDNDRTMQLPDLPPGKRYRMQGLNMVKIEN